MNFLLHSHDDAFLHDYEKVKHPISKVEGLHDQNINERGTQPKPQGLFFQSTNSYTISHILQ